jgi:hypothetical protein
MRFVRYIYRNINPLNIILIMSAVSIALGAFSPYFYPQVRFNLPAAKLPPAEEEKPSEAAVASPSPTDYMVIAEQNLFHPDRKIPVEKKEAQQLPKPELILFGTLITDGMSVAYVEDKKNPKTSPGRGKRQNVMKKGDAVSGFVLKEIEPDRIMLARGDETMVVHLSQGDKSRTSEVPGAAVVSAKPVPGAPASRPGVPTPAKPGQPAAFPAPAAVSPALPKADPTKAFAPPMPGGGRRPQARGTTQTQQGQINNQ